MATQISASRFTNLKARVKAECLRRKYVGTASGSASVSAYGSTSYDYTTAATTGGKILTEHRNKIATPLNAINATTIPNATGVTKIAEADIAAMEAFTTTLEK